MVFNFALASIEREGLKDEDMVRRLHNQYLEVLSYELQQSHGNTHRRVFFDICHVLPKLEPLNKEQAEVVMKFRVDSPPGMWCHR